MKMVMSIQHMPPVRPCIPCEPGVRAGWHEDDLFDCPAALKIVHPCDDGREGCEGMYGGILGDGDMLLDCRTFPDGAGEPDIYIGFGGAGFDPRVVNILMRSFERRGYTVLLDPSQTDLFAPDVPADYTSAGISVNRKTFMNEWTLDKTDGFDRMSDAIRSAVALAIFVRNFRI